MAKKCYRCGSERLTRLVPAGALVVPEISEAVAAALSGRLSWKKDWKPKKIRNNKSS